MDWLWFILIGGIAGWLAGLIMKGRGFGILGNIIVGVIGALVGGFLLKFLSVLIHDGLLGTLITATLGAIVLLFAISLIKRA
ncbi:MAG TPA: GlsB/YeaQ/YmgE family stress response membrane protein [Pirellulaceae bacterium]|nr:GlsB/YeaQ/YmgE family stress response membrane protein [Pirellulaceae bacterium]